MQFFAATLFSLCTARYPRLAHSSLRTYSSYWQLLHSSKGDAFGMHDLSIAVECNGKDHVRARAAAAARAPRFRRPINAGCFFMERRLIPNSAVLISVLQSLPWRGKADLANQALEQRVLQRFREEVCSGFAVSSRFPMLLSTTVLCFSTVGSPSLFLTRSDERCAPKTYQGHLP